MNNIEQDLNVSATRVEKQNEVQKRERAKLNLKVGGLRKTANGIKKIIAAVGGIDSLFSK